MSNFVFLASSHRWIWTHSLKSQQPWPGLSSPWRWMIEDGKCVMQHRVSTHDNDHIFHIWPQNTKKTPPSHSTFFFVPVPMHSSTSVSWPPISKQIHNWLQESSKKLHNYYGSRNLRSFFYFFVSILSIFPHLFLRFPLCFEYTFRLQFCAWHMGSCASMHPQTCCSSVDDQDHTVPSNEVFFWSILQMWSSVIFSGWFLTKLGAVYHDH